jgi:glycosyltransferase involved in cell wall biosynthesis
MHSSFITWYPYCRRSDTIAKALGGESHLIHYLSFKKPLYAPLKYIIQTIVTLVRLWRDAPEMVIVAVPPVFAALPVLAYTRARGARCFIDAHTGVFTHKRWQWLEPLHRAVFRAADGVIVTGPHLKAVAESWGARALIIGDVPVELTVGVPPKPCDGARVVVINTFSVDEPLDEVLRAAAQLEGTSFFITGDTRYAKRQWIDERPGNVCYTGFVNEAEYAGLLRAADLIVVLTTDDHTMQRGGYEAMSLGKPLVTSDWGILRETFSRGTVHVKNTADAIAAGIRRALTERRSLGEEMVLLRSERTALFTERLDDMLSIAGFEAGRRQPQSSPQS